MRLGAGKKGDLDPILLLILDPSKHYTLDTNLIWDTFDLLLDVKSRAGLLPLHRGHRNSLHFKIGLKWHSNFKTLILFFQLPELCRSWSSGHSGTRRRTQGAARRSPGCRREIWELPSLSCTRPLRGWSPQGWPRQGGHFEISLSH